MGVNNGHALARDMGFGEAAALPLKIYSSKGKELMNPKYLLLLGEAGREFEDGEKDVYSLENLPEDGLAFPIMVTDTENPSSVDSAFEELDAFGRYYTPTLVAVLAGRKGSEEIYQKIEGKVLAAAYRTGKEMAFEFLKTTREKLGNWVNDWPEIRREITYVGSE